MTSIATNVSQMINQPQGQVFESLKKQWEASSFDQLFQSTNPNRPESKIVSDHESAPDLNEREHGQTLVGEPVAEAELKASTEERGPTKIQPMLSVAGGDLFAPEQRIDPSEETLGVRQDIRGLSNALDGSADESSVIAAHASASFLNADSIDTASQSVVVGVEGERVRVWMRGQDMRISKEQLISKIRAELSWAGMALDAFVLNGETLVGIK